MTSVCTLGLPPSACQKLCKNLSELFVPNFFHRYPSCRQIINAKAHELTHLVLRPESLNATVVLVLLESFTTSMENTSLEESLQNDFKTNLDGIISTAFAALDNDRVTSSGGISDALCRC